MAIFLFDDAVRQARFDPGKTLRRRGDGDLPFAGPTAAEGNGLLLDTCVYIDQIKGRTPTLVDDLVRRRQTNHSVVAIQELMHAVGALDPKDGRTAAAKAAIRL